MTPQTDLFTSFDDADLANLLLFGPPDTQVYLAGLLGPERSAAILLQKEEDLTDATPSGLTLPPDPNLPEIVLVHGITDCHLANVTKRRNRIWLDLIELVKGSFTKSLTLLPDGVTNQPDITLETDGHVGKKYDRALKAWTAARFRNRVFCYDWRRSVSKAADELGEFLRSLDSVRSGEKVILVCHSMGGLVAATFAARHSDWDTMVKHCVFVGSPLGGSYSVPITVLGHAPSFKKLDRLSIFERLEDFQRMAASFPGLIDMLPHPDLFPDAADFYAQGGWPGPVKPLQAHLDASRAVKDVVFSSPILGKATHLVSQGIETVSAMPWNPEHTDRSADVVSLEGDGAALSLSSLLPGLSAYLVPGEHGTLVNEPSVSDAVMRIARDERPPLSAISRDDLSRETLNARADVEPAGLSISPSEAIDRRIGSGLALHFASEDAVVARSLPTGETGFNREALKNPGFSWDNALSMAIASDEAYRSDSPTMGLRATEVWGFERYRTFENEETQGFVTWDEHTVVVSFRGSEKKVADWVRNLTLISHTPQERNYGRVHYGFYLAYKTVEKQVLSHLNAAGAGGKSIYITGHSLGGAIAIIAGAELESAFPEADFHFYTFGQPKLGGGRFAEFHTNRFPNRYFRFRNHDDIVTRIPPGYSHFGELFWFDSAGNLKVSQAAGLMVSDELVQEEPGDELDEAAFEILQKELDSEVGGPTDGAALYLPPTDAQLETVLRIPGFSVKDHAIRDSYIRIIRTFC